MTDFFAHETLFPFLLFSLCCARESERSLLIAVLLLLLLCGLLCFNKMRNYVFERKEEWNSY